MAEQTESSSAARSAENLVAQREQWKADLLADLLAERLEQQMADPMAPKLVEN